jgi:hypothetical protein
MAKKKKENVDDWSNFIFRLLTRKRADRRFVIPIDYLWSLADKIHKINPTKVIVFNTLKETYCVAGDSAYQKALNDARFFKNKKEQHFKEYWNGLQDYIDDVINNKVQLKQNQ